LASYLTPLSPFPSGKGDASDKAVVPSAVSAYSESAQLRLQKCIERVPPSQQGRGQGLG